MNWEDVYREVTNVKNVSLNFEGAESPFTRSKHVSDAYAKNKMTMTQMVNMIFSNEHRFSTVVLRENEYPYQVADTIDHFVLWFHPSHYDCVPDNVDDVLSVLASTRKKVWFQNPVKWQSVTQIPHVQVFFNLQ